MAVTAPGRGEFAIAFFRRVHYEENQTFCIGKSMHKLPAVEEAKRMFEEAKNWGTWRWLVEKRRARTTADAAWEALEECEARVRSGWSDERRQAYKEERALHAESRKAHKARMDAEE